jgi:hypothetical protein
MAGGQAVIGQVEGVPGLKVRSARGGLVAAVRAAVAGWVRLVAILGPTVVDK